MESEGANSRSNDWKMKEDVEDFHNELHQLGSIYKRLGKSMVDVGLLVARICDMAIPGVQLEETILEACTAKGRLIHYHSLVDRLFLKAFSSSNICKPNRRKKVNQVTGGPTSVVTEASVCKDMWQDWHFDYGIFTVLTVPMFLNPLDIDLNRVDAASIDLKKSRVETSDSVRGLEPNAFHKHIGLKVLIPLDGCMAFVNVPPDCLIVQVGECAQILTGGKLQAIAHCVCRPPNMSDISRETFVVFLQPAWHKQLYWSGSSVDQSTSSHSAKDFNSSEQNSLESKIPALDSRWKNGCTFADFAKETTKQYYGTSGIQSTK
ncbi:hypothetical protein KP509_09G032500 [Ceratopteris richardii]|nr:hypothetical protein KP509_09G032500 [Ceratopteris richardii]